MTLLETLMGGASALAFFPILGGLGVSQNQDYQIARSVRMKGTTSKFQYTLTGASTDTTKGTYNGWIKRCGLGTVQEVVYIGNNTGNANYLLVRWTTFDQLEIYSGANLITSTRVFRDPSAWLNLNIKWDLSQGTAANRVIVEVNGEVVTMTGTYPTISNFDAGNTNIQYLGKSFNGVSDCYYSEQRWIDGQYLAATSFGQFDAVTGVWFPKTYAGTYGNNGFYLNFADNSNNTAATIGKDLSGNAHNFTPTNISVTAGVTNDSLRDTPTNGGTDTGLGGEVTGNYCTLNPLDKMSSMTLADGNLSTGAIPTAISTVRGTLGMLTGKHYFEWLVTAAGIRIHLGMATVRCPLTDYPASSASVAVDGFSWYGGATSIFACSNGSNSTIGVSKAPATNDVMGVAFDADTGKCWVRFNGGSYEGGGNPAAGTTPTFTLAGPGPYFPTAGNTSNTASQSAALNAGQRPFANAAPTGFKALCTQNLPDPAIKKPSDYFDAKTYVGTHAALSVTGVGFQADFGWFKSRASAYDNVIYDSVRGGNNNLRTNATSAESNATTNANFTSFDASGFTLGASSSTDILNGSGDSLVAWLWKKGVLPGLDIVTFNPGASGTATVAHNLGVIPAMVFHKRRDSTSAWYLWHKSLSSNTASYLDLQATAAVATTANMWGTGHTSSNLLFGIGVSVSASSSQVAYAFAEVPGYSKFGSYIANANANGPFVNLGFRPRYILFKNITAAESWGVFDSARSTYNGVDAFLLPNTSAVESTGTVRLDMLSNGFKVRAPSANLPNSTNNDVYIYAAFAEAPFKYARAR